jgi:hypothetical protein
MARLRYRLAVLAVSLLALGASAPAAQADLIASFKNWKVAGKLGVKKLNQDIVLPSGSLFNGTANLTTGAIQGHTTIPDFDATLTILGIPQTASLSITEAAPATGTLTPNPDGTVDTDVTVSNIIRVRKLGIGGLGLGIPAGANCRSSSPVVLPLHTTSTVNDLLERGATFSGTYTITKLTGCGLLTPVLNTLMAGPNNQFAVSMKPPHIP